LKTVTEGNNIVSIGKKAFKLCESLETFKLSDNVRYVGDEAFSGCVKY